MDKAKLVDFGLGGHGIDYGTIEESYGTCKRALSGYSSPETFQRELGEGKYPETDFQGCPVLDKIPALDGNPNRVKIAVRSPMVDVDLEEAEIDTCPKPSAEMVGMLEGAFKTFGALQALHTGPEPGPLDSVSIQRYVAYWVGHGARYGVIHDRVICWA